MTWRGWGDKPGDPVMVVSFFSPLHHGRPNVFHRRVDPGLGCNSKVRGHCMPRYLAELVAVPCQHPPLLQGDPMPGLIVCPAHEVPREGLILHMSSGHRLDDGTLPPSGYPDEPVKVLPNSVVTEVEEYTDIEVVLHFADGTARTVCADSLCEVVVR